MAPRPSKPSKLLASCKLLLQYYVELSLRVVGTGGEHGAVVGRARNSPRPLAGSGDNALKEELGGRVAPGTGSSVWKPLFLGEVRVVASSETHSEGARHSSPPPRTIIPTALALQVLLWRRPLGC